MFISEREEVRVDDAISAQAAAKRHLEAHFGADKVISIRFTRAWYTPGARRDLWEVEGDVIVKKGMFSREVRHFKFQIDPETARVIAFEG